MRSLLPLLFTMACGSDKGDDEGSVVPLHELLGVEQYSIDLVGVGDVAVSCDGDAMDVLVAVNYLFGDEVVPERVVALTWDVEQDSFISAWDLEPEGGDPAAISWSSLTTASERGYACEGGPVVVVAFPVGGGAFGDPDGNSNGVVMGLGYSSSLGGDPPSIFTYTSETVEAVRWRAMDPMGGAGEEGEMSLSDLGEWSAEVSWDGLSMDNSPGPLFGAWALNGEETLGASAM
jgi:hypothetical protein